MDGNCKHAQICTDCYGFGFSARCRHTHLVDMEMFPTPDVKQRAKVGKKPNPFRESGSEDSGSQPDRDGQRNVG